MAKWKNRTCICGKIDFTASKSPVCKNCHLENAKQERTEKERAVVSGAYGNVEGPNYNEFGKRCYTFVHSCGTSQNWVFGNLLKCLKLKPDPCSKCGGTERMKPAMAGYVAKFQLSERARTDLRAYTRRVRGLSEKTYRENIDFINPNKHPRMLGNQGWHLDHKTSIVECFKRGWAPEKAAELGNLQMLSAGDNLSKGRT